MSTTKSQADEALDLLAVWIGARLSIIAHRSMTPFTSGRYATKPIEEFRQIQELAEQELVALGLGTLPGEEKP